MSKLLNFNATSNYEEVADSVGDSLEIFQAGENAAADGLQVGDLFVVLAQEDDVREIINDGPIFVKQLKQLSAETAKASILEAGNRVINNGQTLGPLVRFLMNSLWGLATGYADSVTILEMGQRQLLEKKSLLAGEDVFPPLLVAAA